MDFAGFIIRLAADPNIQAAAVSLAGVIAGALLHKPTRRKVVGLARRKAKGGDPV